MEDHGENIGLLWEQQMEAISRRLINLTHSFYGVLDWADSEADVLDFTRWPNRPAWTTRYDEDVTKFLVETWLAAVNRLVQGKLARSHSDEAVKVVTDEIVAMKPLTDQERGKVLADYGFLADAALPTLVVRGRLANLVWLHVRLARQMPYGGGWDKLRRSQESEAKREFPKALREDLELLARLVPWRALICEHVVNPRLNEIRPRVESTFDESLTPAERGHLFVEMFHSVLKEVAGEPV